MPAVLSRASGRFGAFLLPILLAIAGCSESKPLARAGIAISVPASWTSYIPAHPVWPGDRLSSWKTDSGSFAIYRGLPVPRGSAEGLAKELTSRMENLPGITVISTKPLAVGGLNATRVDLVGTGDGFSFAPTGLGRPVLPKGIAPVQTHRVCIGIPRKSDTVWVVCHYADKPETKALVEPQIEEALGSLKIEDIASSSSRY